MIDHSEWRKINGWLTIDEGLALQELAAGKKVLELGAFCGRSTVCMAQVADLVVSVDCHSGDCNTGFGDTLVGYMASVRRHHNVVPVVARFQKLDLFLTRSFDLVFVDGQHDHASVIHDTKLAVDLVVPGGVIAWHDFGDVGWPDVEAAVVEVLGEVDGHAGYLGWRQIP